MFFARVPVPPTSNLLTFQFADRPTGGSGSTTVFDSAIPNTWDGTPMEFRFPTGRTFSIQSSLTADDVTFTASGTSWSGVRVQGAAHASFDGVTIEKVSAGASGVGASLAYIDSEPNIRNSLIQSSVGPGVDGIYLSGGAQIGIIDEVTIDDVSGDGIGAQGEFDYVRFINNVVTNNNGHGFFFGFKSTGFLGANTVQQNGGQGLYAYDGDVYLAGVYNGSSGNNVLLDNDMGGVLNRAGSVIRGGTSTRYKTNSFVENGQPGAQWFDPPGNAKEGPDAWSRDAGTIAYLRNGWWGRPANPDTTSCASIPCSGVYTGTLFVDPMLAFAPGGGSAQKGGAGGEVGAMSAARTALLAASDAAADGRRGRALGLWRGVAFSAPHSTGAAVAIAEIGRLVGDERRRGGESVRAEALALLEGWAAEGAPQRARALVTLAKARADLGDRAGALAAADALAAMEDAEASLEGHVARFHFLLGSGQPDAYARAASALHRLESAAPGSEEARWARRALTIRAGAEVAGAAPHASGADALAKAGGADPATSEASLSVWPNPSAGAATVGLTVGDDAEGTVAVYDARGREVAVLHEGPLAAGGHRLDVPAGLAPGPYLVRARLGGSILTRTLTVVR